MQPRRPLRIPQRQRHQPTGVQQLRLAPRRRADPDQDPVQQLIGLPRERQILQHVGSEFAEEDARIEHDEKLARGHPILPRPLEMHERRPILHAPENTAQPQLRLGDQTPIPEGQRLLAGRDRLRLCGRQPPGELLDPRPGEAPAQMQGRRAAPAPPDLR